MIYSVGEKFTKSVHFDASGISQFANAAGDLSPLHHDELFAQTTRFSGLIASGTQYSALLMGMVATYLTSRSAGLGLSFAFEFKKAVPAGSTCALEWEIVSVAPHDGLQGEVVSLDGCVKLPDGTIAATASAKTVVFPPEVLVKKHA